MPLPPDFQSQLLDKADADLYEMLVQHDDYLPEAIEAVKEEISRRNLPPDRAEQLQVAAETRKSQEEKRAVTGLPWYVKVLILVGLLPIIWFAIYYEGRGHKKKAHQCWAWAGFSLVFWFVIGVLAALAG